MNGIVCSDIPHTRRIKITDLNPHLMCVLCGGYYIDATTIIECLHSFCKTCIVKYLETSKFCPICDVQVHKTKPLLNIRSDQTLQDIVYKLVPGLFQREMKRRRDFYAKHPHDDHRGSNPRSNEERGEVESDVPRNIFMPDEFISIALEYSESGGISNSPDKDDRKDKSQHMCRHYLRCPVFITVAHIKKLVRAKYSLSIEHRVDVLFSQDNLNDGFMLMDIAYMYAWKRKGPLKLFFRIFDAPSKRLKTCHPAATPLFGRERARNFIEGKGSSKKRGDAPLENAEAVPEVEIGDETKTGDLQPSDDATRTEIGDDQPAISPSTESQRPSDDGPLPADQTANIGDNGGLGVVALPSTTTMDSQSAVQNATSTALEPPCTMDITKATDGASMKDTNRINNGNEDAQRAEENQKQKEPPDREEPPETTVMMKEIGASIEKHVQNLPNGEVIDSITLNSTATKDEKTMLDKVNGVTTNGNDIPTFIQIYSK